MSVNKATKGIPVSSKIPTSGRDSGTHSRSSSVSNLTTASDIHSEAGDKMPESSHDFKIEDRVWVNGTKAGYIKFLGKTQFAPGEWAGVLLDEPAGKNDGSVAGVKYFSCEPLHGIFSRPQKLTRTSGPTSGAGDKSSVISTTPRVGSASSRTTSSVTPLSRALATSTASLSSQKSVCSRLRLGERVVVSSVTGLKSGILRYLGEADFAKGEWAGIELDEPVGKNDGSVAGKRYFSCQMKYGLFSPLHKISRAGGTFVSRTPSVRGTPSLMRSTSRDSICSSVSTSSKQKARATGGIGVMTTSRALEEALKEKEVHIEQLLKEQDLERGEVARVSIRCEQFQTKCNELLEIQGQHDNVLKDWEQQLSAEKRKLEDLQFQLEEERIMKGDLEMQFKQQNEILIRIEKFLNGRLEANFINIKEILEGKETLSEVPDAKEPGPQEELFTQKINKLEANLETVTKEKRETAQELDNLKNFLSETEKKNENLLWSLNNNIQEKDDVITNLKCEMQAQLQKVTSVTEDNNNLNEQLRLQASEAKGHTDEVIKELGEKIKRQSEELNAKSGRLQENEIAIEAKDIKISTLENSLKGQNHQITDVQSKLQDLEQALNQKATELSESSLQQKGLKDEIVTLKSKAETNNTEKDEKILGLVNELERITSELQEKEEAVAQKQEEVSTQHKRIDELSEVISQSQSRVKELEENSSTLTSDSSKRMSTLQDELKKLQEEKENVSTELEKKLQTVQAEFSLLSQELETAKECLAKKESYASVLMQNFNEKDSACVALQSQLADVKKDCNVLEEEKTEFMKSLKTTEALFAELKQQLEESKKFSELSNKELSEKRNEVDVLHNALKDKDQALNQLGSKLHLAEQNVEMLNKDSSEHVMTLQNELSKVKEESTKVVTSMQQELSELKKENEKICIKIQEKDTTLKEKGESISTLKDAIKEKEENLAELSAQLEKVKDEVSLLNKSKEELQELHKTSLQNAKQEFDSQLAMRETKLSEIQTECDNLSEAVTEKNNFLAERDTTLLSLQSHLKERETEVSNLQNLTEKQKTELDTLCKDKGDVIILREKELQSLKEQYASTLKAKDEIVIETQAKISASNQLLQLKGDELQQKESEITSLRNALKTKESQFDELSQIIEASQGQLKELLERNNSNECLLQSRETYIGNFKAEKERQILDLEKKLKAETTALEELLSKREQDIKEKGEIILKLNTEAKEQQKQLELLGSDLGKSKADNEKSIQSTSEIQKGLADKIAELEAKYSKLIDEKEMLAKEHQKASGEKKTLEEMKNSLLQEKVHQEEVVRDRETKLESLQSEVQNMQAQFMLHKQELQQKLDVSEMEVSAAQELKREMELQHNVLEELQEELHKSQEKNKEFETQNHNMSVLSSEKNELLNKLNKLEKSDQEKYQKILHLAEQYKTLEELNKCNENEALTKEKECIALNEKVKALEKETESKDNLSTSVKSVEQENILLKHQVEKLEKADKNANPPAGQTSVSAVASEERESLLSQIDFLNSIIVDMKNKNETLQQEIEILHMNPLDVDSNLNDTPKKLAPRLFCDICDMFDLHDTDDCPKQESFVEDEAVPHLLPQGARKLEERPYCNNCEVFGHWTFDCEEQETY